MDSHPCCTKTVVRIFSIPLYYCCLSSINFCKLILYLPISSCYSCCERHPSVYILVICFTARYFSAQDLIGLQHDIQYIAKSQRLTFFIFYIHIIRMDSHSCCTKTVIRIFSILLYHCCFSVICFCKLILYLPIPSCCSCCKRHSSVYILVICFTTYNSSIQLTVWMYNYIEYIGCSSLISGFIFYIKIIGMCSYAICLKFIMRITAKILYNRFCSIIYLCIPVVNYTASTSNFSA